MLPKKLNHPYEKVLVKNHLTILKDEDRHLRFGAMLNDESIEKYVDDQWNEQGAWFGIYDGNKIIACVHVAVVGDEAELGLSVEPEYRGQKIGQRLFERAVLYIKSMNIKHVFMHCLSENAVMKHIANKYGMTMITSYGETDARTTIDFPFTPLDAINEAVAQQLALYDNSIRAFAKAWTSYIERIWDSLPKHPQVKVNNG